MATSTFPNWLAGNRVTAAQLNAGLPLTIVKPADEPLTSNATLQNDNDLLVSVAANATYKFDCTLIYEGGTNGASDLKFKWAVPASATLTINIPAYFFTDNTTHGPSYIDQTTTQALGTRGAGVRQSVAMTGSLLVSSTSGTLQLTWAQNTSSATATIVHAQSTLTLQRTS